jgi:hypothetical protein
VQAAQKKLYRLRQEQEAKRPASVPPLSETATQALSSKNSATSFVLPNSPSHLGWESAPLTAVIRTAQARKGSCAALQQNSDLSWLDDLASRREATVEVCSPTLPDSIKLHPDLALAMLRQEKCAAGRIWLLLRVIDHTGRGWVDIAQARALLTDKNSHLHVCGWRQLRNLLTQGETLFWQRRSDRLWLRSLVKVAASLDVWRLSSCPVVLPVNLLTQGIGQVRAHFYASFHSGRAVKDKSGASKSMPISRATLKKLCRISYRSQRKYERIAKVRHQRNYAVGAKAQIANTHEAAWRHGQALFQLRDQKGKQGVQETTYLAWQLPNNYFGPHDQQSRGQQKQINQKLAVLSMQGMTGNGQQRVERDPQRHVKRFFGSGRLAAKAYNQPANQDIYWCPAQSASPALSRIWHCLPGKP